MTRHNQQRGQALVGVLVIMTLVFAFAGALAVASSNLFRDQEAGFQPFANDLTLRNTVAATIAQAGLVPSCAPPPVIVSPAFPPSLFPFGPPCGQVISPIGTNGPSLMAFPDAAGQKPKGCPDYCAGFQVAAPLMDGSRLWFTTRGRAAAWMDDDSKCQGFLGYPTATSLGVTQIQLLVTLTPTQKWVCFRSTNQLPIGMRYDDGSDLDVGHIQNMVVPVGPPDANGFLPIEEVDLCNKCNNVGSLITLRWEEPL